MDNKDQFKGKVKQAVGDLTDNKDLKREGKADEQAGRAKELLHDAKEKADHAIDVVKEELQHH